jgi:putative transcriptional regulator
MGEFEALRHLDVHAMPPRKIRSLREDARVSQAVFAAALNTSAATVQKWEAGDKKPSGPALKLPNLIERKGLEAVIERFPASHYSRPGATAPAPPVPAPRDSNPSVYRQKNTQKAWRPRQDHSPLRGSPSGPVAFGRRSLAALMPRSGRTWNEGRMRHVIRVFGHKKGRSTCSGPMLT